MGEYQKIESKLDKEFQAYLAGLISANYFRKGIENALQQQRKYITKEVLAGNIKNMEQITITEEVNIPEELLKYLKQQWKEELLKKLPEYNFESKDLSTLDTFAGFDKGYLKCLKTVKDIIKEIDYGYN